jgi:hypothetical protein
MNDVVDITLLVLGLLATMSALLYVLANIDPQTQKAPRVQEVAAPQGQLSNAG